MVSLLHTFNSKAEEEEVLWKASRAGQGNFLSGWVKGPRLKQTNEGRG